MKVFLDTNVIIDYLAVREPFFKDAATIVELCRKHQLEGMLSALTIVNTVYVLRKAYGKHVMAEKAKWLMNTFTISAIDRKALQKALDGEPYDFEDAVQEASALAVFADVIVTRDKKGFAGFDIPVMTPNEFIARCKE